MFLVAHWACLPVRICTCLLFLAPHGAFLSTSPESAKLNSRVLEFRRRRLVQKRLGVRHSDAIGPRKRRPCRGGGAGLKEGAWLWTVGGFSAGGHFC